MWSGRSVLCLGEPAKNLLTLLQQSITMWMIVLSPCLFRKWSYWSRHIGNRSTAQHKSTRHSLLLALGHDPNYLAVQLSNLCSPELSHRATSIRSHALSLWDQSSGYLSPLSVFLSIAAPLSCWWKWDVKTCLHRKVLHPQKCLSLLKNSSICLWSSSSGVDSLGMQRLKTLIKNKTQTENTLPFFSWAAEAKARALHCSQARSSPHGARG